MYQSRSMRWPRGGDGLGDGVVVGGGGVDQGSVAVKDEGGEGGWQGKWHGWDECRRFVVGRGECAGWLGGLRG